MLALLLFLLLGPRLPAQPSPQARRAFQACTASIRARLTQPLERVAASNGVTLQPLPAPTDLPGALIHHWRATVLLPGVHAAELQHLLLDLHAYPQVFAPEVVRAHVLLHTPDAQDATLRLRQKHVLTVTLDATFHIVSSPPDPVGGTLSSESTHIVEVADAGTPNERPLPPDEDHGFLWAQNTYWRWRELPEGLQVELESVSLSRGIPSGLGWAVRPLVSSVPRDSLRFTLDRVAEALKTPASPLATRSFQ